jgi:hypothetical protein
MDWRDCIVVYIDVIDIKKRAKQGKSVGSSLMRAFHKLILDEMSRGLPSLDHAYAWNDSALLLGFVDGSSGAYERCLREAEILKRKVDAIAKSYGIAVKGQAFPELPDSNRNGRTAQNRRATILRTSSWAMANIFEIERAVKKLRAVWYLDKRVAERLTGVRPNGHLKLKLLPENKQRNVFYYDHYLWS